MARCGYNGRMTNSYPTPNERDYDEAEMAASEAEAGAPTVHVTLQTLTGTRIERELDAELELTMLQPIGTYVTKRASDFVAGDVTLSGCLVLAPTHVQRRAAEMNADDGHPLPGRWSRDIPAPAYGQWLAYRYPDAPACFLVPAPTVELVS